MSVISQSFEALCDKQFDLARVQAYEGVNRDIVALKHRFAAMGALRSSNMAQALVDLVLSRYDRVLGAFEEAYFQKWAGNDKELSTTDYDWLNAKITSKIDPEILEARSRCQSALSPDSTFTFAHFWQEAEVQARERRLRLQKKLEILKLQKENAKTNSKPERMPVPAEAAPIPSTFWNNLHPTVVAIARPRFEAGHLADAVEACLKEVNDIVRKIVFDKTGKEYDGADLMNRAFSVDKPIIRLDDLTTTSGRNIQIGYMQIFAGSMTGIRNPKAHSNIDISAARALHLLFLASLLFSKLDERVD